MKITSNPQDTAFINHVKQGLSVADLVLANKHQHEEALKANDE